MVKNLSKSKVDQSVRASSEVGILRFLMRGFIQSLNRRGRLRGAVELGGVVVYTSIVNITIFFLSVLGSMNATSGNVRSIGG